MQINQIYNEDCVETIKRMPDNFINMVITSPPYNVDLGNNKYHHSPYDVYNDNKNYTEYLSWLKSIFKNLFPKMKNDSRVCVNIGNTKNGSVTLASDTIQFMKDLDYKPYTTIIWNKSQIGNRTSWGSFMSPSCPSFPTPFEYILVFYKNDKKRTVKGLTDLTKEEFIEWSLALWSFAPETKQKAIGHNAMFPLELPKRLLKMFSYIDDLIYDPFSGAGTTALTCKLYNRNFIGSEISPEYCNISNKRLNIL